MKRILGIVATVVTTLVIGTGTAFAQSTYPPEPTDPSSVLGGGGSSGSATAFTGSDVATWAVVAGALLLAGLAALFVARRRAARVAA